MSRNGKQRFLCGNEKRGHKTFIERYTNSAYDPNIRSRIFFSIAGGSGTRATARTPGIAKDAVTSALRSVEALLRPVNYDCLNSRRNGDVTVEFVPVNEVEMDKMRGFAEDKSSQYWLWRATGHNTGGPLAFHFGARKYENPDELLALPEPFDIKIAYSDKNFAYQSRVTKSEVVTGKENTQKIERKRLSLRTWRSRLVRKGIRFSKAPHMRKIVVALVINFWFFQRIIW